MKCSEHARCPSLGFHGVPPMFYLETKLIYLATSWHLLENNKTYRFVLSVTVMATNHSTCGQYTEQPLPLLSKKSEMDNHVFLYHMKKVYRRKPL